MQLSQLPTLLKLAFASLGGKNTIPVASQLPGNINGASYTDGFPPATRTAIVAGGKPPAGLDMNGVLFDVSSHIRWLNAGGPYAYDSGFATDSNVGGYPQGAQITSADLQGAWMSLNDNNTDNPDTGAGTKWVPTRAYGITAIAGLTNANVTLTPAQAAKNKITLAGTLTGNVQIILPTWLRDWVVTNNTTGAFTVTCKTAAGSGVAIPQNGSPTKIVGDGTNIAQPAENIPPATQSQQPVQLGQVGDNVGRISFFARNTPPTGHLAADGSAVSRTTYAALFAAIGTTFGAGDGSTTFNVPDLRGRFARGYDNGAGVDPGRAFGSVQADSFASHNHGVTDPQHTHGITVSSGAGVTNNLLVGQLNQAPGTLITGPASTGISIQNTGGTETRPKNVALLACIKY